MEIFLSVWLNQVQYMISDTKYGFKYVKKYKLSYLCVLSICPNPAGLYLTRYARYIKDYGSLGYSYP